MLRDLGKSPYHGQPAAPAASDERSAKSADGQATVRPPRRKGLPATVPQAPTAARSRTPTGTQPSARPPSPPASAPATPARAASVRSAPSRMTSEGAGPHSSAPTYQLAGSPVLDGKDQKLPDYRPRTPPPPAWAPSAAGPLGAPLASQKPSKPSMISKLKTSLRTFVSSRDNFAKGCIIGAAGLLVMGLMCSNPFLLAIGMTLFAVGFVGFLMSDPNAKAIAPVAKNASDVADGVLPPALHHNERKADSAGDGSSLSSLDKGLADLRADDDAASKAASDASIHNWSKNVRDKQQRLTEAQMYAEAHRGASAPPAPPATVGTGPVPANAADAASDAWLTPDAPSGSRPSSAPTPELAPQPLQRQESTEV